MVFTVVQLQPLAAVPNTKLKDVNTFLWGAGIVQWTDIEVEVDHQIVSEPVWHAVEESPKCKSKAVVVNSTSVKITWDATAPDPQ
eukprot:COSAG02_NODE_4583_length_5190_cov_4.804753_4_plen_85_part_00